MNKLGGVRWQMWAAGFAFVATAAGGFVGCDDDETTGATTSATGTGTGTATTSTGTGTASNTTTSTTNAGCGGAAACEQLCEDAQAKYAACFVQGSGGGNTGGGGGSGGGGGAGGGGGSPSGTGGGETWNYDCDEQGECYSRCIMDATCEDIRVHDDSYDSCVGCCNDPYLC